MRILVAEDDVSLGAVLERGLRENGYVVDLVPDGETAATYLRQPADRIAGLDAGADDYLIKPFDFGEQLARLRALLRRSPAVAEWQTIAQHVWDEELDGLASNTISVHLARLRSKLAGAGVRIETVRGIGYRIVAL